MRINYLILMIVLFSCKNVEISSHIKEERTHKLKTLDLFNYRVLEVDSIRNVYVIYAKKKDTYFKILSLKTEVESCNKIMINQKYPFILQSLFPKDFKGKYDLSHNNLPHVNGIDFYGEKIEFEGDSIKDIYTSMNIRGLCFIN